MTVTMKVSSENLKNSRDRKLSNQVNRHVTVENNILISFYYSECTFLDSKCKTVTVEMATKNWNNSHVTENV